MAPGPILGELSGEEAAFDMPSGDVANPQCQAGVSIYFSSETGLPTYLSTFGRQTGHFAKQLWDRDLRKH